MTGTDKRNVIPRKHKERFERETLKINNNRAFIIVASIFVFSIVFMIHRLSDPVGIFDKPNFLLHLMLAVDLVFVLLLIILRYTKMRYLMFGKIIGVALIVFFLIWSGYMAIYTDNPDTASKTPYITAMFVIVILQYTPPKLAIPFITNPANNSRLVKPLAILIIL